MKNIDCTKCGGRGFFIPKSDFRGAMLPDYKHPKNCPHCHGTGDEPEDGDLIKRITFLYKTHIKAWQEMESLFKIELEPFASRILEAKTVEEVEKIKIEAKKRYSEIKPFDFDGSVEMLSFLDGANRKIRSIG